ncbi:MAG: 3-oxo-tetronate kinase [Pseudomonadota bacterium]
MALLLGAIADDITGATDLALMLSRSGMRTIQVMGVPSDTSAFADADAVVVALKSRTNPVDEAVRWSLRACDVLSAAGAEQIFFKYCSTFDSTDEGNIGPVADALMQTLGADAAFVCPAFPANGRSVYKGHLFVGDTLLSDSPMKDHPLTPMRDANLVRVMARQSDRPVVLVDAATVSAGADAVRTAIAATADQGPRFVVADAIDDAHLMTLGAAAAGHRLITGGSGIALGLADNFEAAGKLTKTPPPETITGAAGRAAILAGSCSVATRGQVAHAIEDGVPARKLDPAKVVSGETSAADLIDWAANQPADAPVLIYSSDSPDAVGQAQAALGRDASGAAIERLLADVAGGLAGHGFTRMIVAGGETSGAVADGLGVSAIEIGPEIDPGVPWVKSRDGRDLLLAFKSGNFGTEDFFTKAWSRIS